MNTYTLVIAEKPRVAANIAAALGVKEKQDGYIAGNSYLISWCVGHLVGLAEADAYGEQYKKWSYDSLPISTNLEAVTAQYVDVRLERKKSVLETYHKALHPENSVSKKEVAQKDTPQKSKKKGSDIEL